MMQVSETEYGIESCQPGFAVIVGDACDANEVLISFELADRRCDVMR